jgi:tetratricopeptide (TPR) repeat protein
MEGSPVSFLNVPLLLETSQVRPRLQWTRFAMGGFGMAVLFAWLASRGTEGAEQVVSLVATVGMLALVGLMAGTSFAAVRGQRAEYGRVEAIEELVQLRRWPEAAMLLQSTLLTPLRSPVSRAQALLYLAMVLGRYHRFEDAIAVYDYLLEEIPLDEAGNHAVRLGRTMALLHEDHLLDADRAIMDLRRTDREGESGGLALVEIYRDVKTGHPAEAIDMFEKRLPQLRKQLGHRIADAWALAARAYDLLGKTDQARAAYENATLLAPLGELQRKYTEIKALAEKYAPAAAPAEVA